MVDACVSGGVSTNMLSYMLPVEEKPPAGAGPGAGRGRLQLELASPPPSCAEGQVRRAGGRPPVAPPPPPSAISKESSTSSFASSDLTTGSSMTPTGPAHEKPRHKLLANGTKHTTLKRVSFGSSKGSMVETLIYESPLAEEPEGSPAPPPRPHETSFPYSASVAAAASAAAAAAEADADRSKVRVSFYQGARPQCVSPPPPAPAERDPHESLATLLAAAAGADMAAATAVVLDAAQPHYNRQISTESGWDNPFRPDGDLSREADEIVSLIKGGKPITPTFGTAAAQLPSVDEIDKRQANNLNAPPGEPPTKVPSPKLPGSPAARVAANGTKNGGVPVAELRAGAVEVQRTAPPEPQQAEHIVLKKKPKCKCCVVQ